MVLVLESYLEEYASGSVVKLDANPQGYLHLDEKSDLHRGVVPVPTGMTTRSSPNSVLPSQSCPHIAAQGDKMCD